MRILILASFWMLVAAKPNPQYGPPQQIYSQPAPQYGVGGGVHKHVFVHVAAPEPEEPRKARVYVPQTPEKHYKILFIKAPAPPPPEQQEVELPPHPEQKTLVYVLLRKPEPAPEVKVHAPAPTKPSKPEVYFIRYKNNNPPASGYGPGPQAAPQPAPVYGTPTFK